MDLSLPDGALARYLEGVLPGFRGPLRSSKFKGGQSNPTYLIEAASGRYVLRRKPPGTLLASAHAVDREFRVLGALHGGPVPVAQPLHLCRDESVVGSMFYLMEYVDGRIFWDPSLPDLDAVQRTAHYREVVATLAALHGVDVAAAGLSDFGKPGNYFARQLSRWSEQYQQSRTREIPAMDELIERLPGRCPADDGVVCLTHGDFRIDNLMFAKDAARVAAVVDWELSTLGHPLADLGYLCMALRLPRNPTLPGLGSMDRAALGIPSEREMLALYSELSGRPLPTDWSFVLAFSFFRLAAIAQGVARRVQQGNASSEQAEQAGAMTGLLAQEALRCLETEGGRV